MSYMCHTPNPHLARYVASIWVQESTIDASTNPFPPTRVLPTGSVDVAFYFRDPFYELQTSGPSVLPAAVVTGPQTAPRHYGALGRTGIVLVRFRPGAAAVFLHTPLGELRDANIDLELLLSADRVREVEARVREAAGRVERVAIIERFIHRTMRPAGRQERALAVVHQVAAMGGRSAVGAVARVLQMGTRQLERTFREFVGLSPKTFSRIVRFQRALDRRTRGDGWAAIAHDCGYHDQAHMCNDFTRLSGLSPEFLLVRSQQTSLAKFFNGSGMSSRFCKTVYA